MGDLSAEPSMEEILSSIKRIIAEEGEAPGRARRAGRQSAAGDAQAAPVAPADGVLELSDPMPATPAAVELARRGQAQPPQHYVPAAQPVEAAPADTSPPAQPAPAAPIEPPIISPAAADASRGALSSLARMRIRGETGGETTLDGLVREMLRPMLREWLDQHLPELVEAMVAKEIERIAQAGE
jgi:uncharacterized protein